MVGAHRQPIWIWEEIVMLHILKSALYCDFISKVGFQAALLLMGAVMEQEVVVEVFKEAVALAEEVLEEAVTVVEVAVVYQVVFSFPGNMDWVF